MNPHQLAANAVAGDSPVALGQGGRPSVVHGLSAAAGAARDAGLHLTGPLLAALAVVTIGYVLLVAGWPYVRCRRCHGAGRLGSPLGRAHRLCPRCTGSGRRLRPARRAWNYYRRLKTRP